MKFTRGDMLRVCPKYVSALAGILAEVTGNKPLKVNKGSVMKAARQAYTKEYDSDTADAADFGSYKVEEIRWFMRSTMPGTVPTIKSLLP